jgi:hypothetical protein
MVGTEWIEHSTPTVSMWCSPTELRARTGMGPRFNDWRLFENRPGRPFGGPMLFKRLDRRERASRLQRETPMRIMVLAAIVFLAGAGPAAAQSTTTFAIVQTAAGSVVGHVSGNGSPTTGHGVLYDRSTAKSSPLPIGTKVTPLYAVSNGAGMPAGEVSGANPPLIMKQECTGSRMPSVILPPTSPHAVVKGGLQRWRCVPRGV